MYLAQDPPFNCSKSLIHNSYNNERQRDRGESKYTITNQSTRFSRDTNYNIIVITVN